MLHRQDVRTMTHHPQNNSSNLALEFFRVTNWSCVKTRQEVTQQTSGSCRSTAGSTRASVGVPVPLMSEVPTCHLYLPNRVLNGAFTRLVGESYRANSHTAPAGGVTRRDVSGNATRGGDTVGGGTEESPVRYSRRFWGSRRSCCFT